MRTPIIAANWKMYKTRDEARTFVESFIPKLKAITEVEVLIAPPFTSLAAVNEMADGSFGIAGQNLFPSVEGAYTGEISPLMLKEFGCEYVIVGHSERRQLFNEDDDFIARKVRAALDHNLTPILCVGEGLEERKTGRTDQVIVKQLQVALEDLKLSRDQDLVIAYEPVWAIGTGETASPEDAQAGAALVREQVVELLGESASQRVRIQYGGSVKPGNAAELLSLPEIDGALVGGASLDPDSFLKIIKAVVEDL